MDLLEMRVFSILWMIASNRAVDIVARSQITTNGIKHNKRSPIVTDAIDLISYLNSFNA